MQLHRERQAFEDEGARLVIIGNGAPNFIEGFRERSGYQGPIYTDPELHSYRALELRRDLGSTFSMGTLKRSVAAFRAGYRQTETQGDAFQQGGVFVVAPGGEVIYQFRSQHAGDHPPVGDLVEAARRAATAVDSSSPSGDGYGTIASPGRRRGASGGAGDLDRQTGEGPVHRPASIPHDR